MTKSVQSEVGQLRQVIVHRPGPELARLTPSNIGDLLFDDVMWASKAREEHDAFADVLRHRGVQVHHFGHLLTETLLVPEGRAYVLDQVCTPEMVGPVLRVFVAVAVVVSFGVEQAARRTQQAAREAEAARRLAEADRMRTALLATVCHDLRSPLAAAKAAVSCLRSQHAELTAEDHDELLAAAEESLDRLTHLAAGLLDVGRLQAGALPVFPRPSDLGEIIASSLGDFGPLARAVTVNVPCDLPPVMADPAIMERVIVNLVGNALRYAPAGSPLRLTASALGDGVQLRVIDRGPGIPEADRERAFLPFQRLGDTSQTTGVGLGLALSRGLTEAMGGAVELEETPGGGLTIAVSLPAVPRPAQTRLTARPGRPEDRSPA